MVGLGFSRNHRNNYFPLYPANPGLLLMLVYFFKLLEEGHYVCTAIILEKERAQDSVIPLEAEPLDSITGDLSISWLS